jgi:hypothetical protein
MAVSLGIQLGAFKGLEETDRMHSSRHTATNKTLERVPGIRPSDLSDLARICFWLGLWLKGATK